MKGYSYNLYLYISTIDGISSIVEAPEEFNING